MQVPFTSPLTPQIATVALSRPGSAQGGFSACEATPVAATANSSKLAIMIKMKMTVRVYRQKLL